MHDASLFPPGRCERRYRTVNALSAQGKKRIAAYASSVYHGAMAETLSPASRKLKQLRQRAGLSIREVAHALGMENGSSYQHYEDRFRKQYLPLELTQRLVPIFAAKGIDAAELLALAGVDGARGLGKAAAAAGMMRIDELDVSASAGHGLISDSEKVVAEWQLPSEVVRYHSRARAEALRC